MHENGGENAELDAQFEALRARNRALETENERLRVSDARWRALLCADALGVMLMDQSGRVLEINALFCHLLGRSREELSAQTLDFRRYVPRELWPDHERHGRILWEAAFCPAWQTLLLRPDGSRVPIVTGAALVGREPRHILIWALDDAPRAGAEVELRAAEARMRAVVESLHEGLLLTDLEDVVLYANERMAQMCGYAPEEIVGRPAYELFLPRELWPLQLERNRERQAGSGEQYELLARRKDGSAWWALVNGSPLRDASGAVVGTIGAQSDISERVAAQAQARELAVQLERSNAALGSFAYAASHDLQEPLRKIRVFGGRLQEELEDVLVSERGRDDLRRLLLSAQRMQQLIADLLEFSRLHRPARFALVDLDELVHDAASDHEAALEERGGTLHIEPLPSLVGDRTRLRQLFGNLIGNALKFHAARPPEVHIAATLLPGTEQDGLRWEIAVRDNGIGFDLSEWPHLLEPFGRGQARALYPGSGLGLAICRTVAQEHGGDLRAASLPGQGTTIFVTLSPRPAEVAR